MEGNIPSYQIPQFYRCREPFPFITKDLEDVLEPIEFRTKGGLRAIGYRAELLPEVIEVYLRARAAGKLKGRQKEIADQAEILGRGLMRLGIVALVDEVTGFQEVRDRDALQEILTIFLRTELAAWAKRFPDEFYRQIYKLRGWQWKGRAVNPPQVVAYYTKDIVYSSLGARYFDGAGETKSFGSRRAETQTSSMVDRRCRASSACSASPRSYYAHAHINNMGPIHAMARSSSSSTRRYAPIASDA